MFVDASAMVAIIAREPGSDALLSPLEGASIRLTSAIAILETVMALRRLGGGTVVQAEQLVRQFMKNAAVDEVPISSEESGVAIRAYARYGKGQGHPAQLNLGDCFAYACAKTRGMPLLFIGDDFSRTDIPSAMR